jgi:hypothetical protein
MQKSPHFSGRLRGTRISDDQYAKLISSYRVNLTDHTAAAEVAGVTYTTARKAFEVGLTVSGVRQRPISEIIAQELRAAVVELDRLRGDRSQRTDISDAIDREVLEIQANNVTSAKGAVTNAIAGHALTSHLLQGAMRLAERVSQALDDPSYCPSPREAVSLLRAIAHTAHFTMESSRVANELQHHVKGNMDIRKLSGGMTAEEAQEVVASAGRSSERLRRAKTREALRGVVDTEAVPSEIEAEAAGGPDLGDFEENEDDSATSAQAVDAMPNFDI